MNFLVDAQLPRLLARRLREAGHDAVHTLDLPNANKTTDQEINEVSLRENRVLITKDADFVSSFLLHARPFKLLLVATGNTTNAALETCFVPNIPKIVEAFKAHSYVELTQTALVVHS